MFDDNYVQTVFTSPGTTTTVTRYIDGNNIKIYYERVSGGGTCYLGGHVFVIEGYAADQNSMETAVTAAQNAQTAANNAKTEAINAKNRRYSKPYY